MTLSKETEHAKLLAQQADKLSLSVNNLTFSLSALNKSTRKSRLAIWIITFTLVFDIAATTAIVIFSIGLNSEEQQRQVLNSQVICPLYENALGLANAFPSAPGSLTLDQQQLYTQRLSLLKHGIEVLMCR